MQEWRNIELLAFSCRLDTKNARLPVHVCVRLHQKIIALMNKTLSNFSNLFLRYVSILELLDVFAPSYLFLL